MVQKKEPTNSSSQPSNIQIQQSINKHAGNTMMETKKLRLQSRNQLGLESSDQFSMDENKNNSSSVKRIARQLPNYMRSTTSSAARKEQVQVTCHAKLNSSKTTSSGKCATSVSKPARNLKIKSSFKVARIPNIVRSNYVSSASSKLGVNRHTCSSTIKDAKFPKALELSPGATEAEGTSVMKVCPYKYCSLNGHRHDCLPPLKCFLASKRKLMEAQKSMKIKGVSPFRKSLSVKDKEIDTGQPVARTRSELEITSLIEEVYDDFFVDMYCISQGEVVAKPVSCEERSTEDSGKTFESDDKKDEDVTPGTDRESVINCDLDSNRDNSIVEFIVTVDFQDNASCEHKYEAEKENLESIAPEDHTTVDLEGHSNGEITKDSEGFVEDYTNNKMANFEACEMDLEDMDNKSVLSADFSDELLMLGNIIENDNICNDVKIDADVIAGDADYALQHSTQTEENVSEHDDSMDFSSTDSGSEFSQDETADFVQANDKKNQVETKEDELHSTNKSISDTFVKDSDEGQTMEEDVAVIDFEDANDNQSNITESEVLTLEELQDEADEGENDQQLQHKKKARRSEKKSLEEFALNDCSLELLITRNKIAKEMNERNDVNFRGPDFLPEEPDPEAEKVDLRHQTVDERKNAEEWMIDYALQKAVTKLASARQRKVSLLVEAFETVVPLPLCEKPLQNVNQAYANARPLQACN